MVNRAPTYYTRVAIVHLLPIFRHGVRNILNQVLRNPLFIEFDRQEEMRHYIGRCGLPDLQVVDCTTVQAVGLDAEYRTIRFARQLPSILIVRANDTKILEYMNAEGIDAAMVASEASVFELIECCRAFLKRRLSSVAVLRCVSSRETTTVSRQSLTPRQTEVLQCLIDGQTNDEIALYLNISVHTARCHVSAILKALGVSSRARASAVGREVLF